ncbi:uncharacterized protein LOC106179951 isoform X2 [Lingula anatina]|uniref:Uncharacterized protein LOC106179951 isoform X1 n=1 Tax=Lingula anatina TaxID=7574 RepID=A0A1S3K9D0_LINAN|nr:uncharacterized protein LOC106179951 isoform X1 [Lingula anatina]XP_013419234.1 uncharacterized protein LOC106179951 isoform X2 [Lingula anatina]|eukprot:XP_013419233.1 uncharacterized protein LOC106179951 isoform X1 [Lingula anatina]
MAKYLILLCVVAVTSVLGSPVSDEVSLLTRVLEELMDSENLISKKSEGCMDQIIGTYTACYKKIGKMASESCESRVDHGVQFLACIGQATVAENCKSEMSQRIAFAVSHLNSNLKNHNC